MWLKIGLGLAAVAGIWWGVHWFNGVLDERDELRDTTKTQGETIVRFEEDAKQERESALILQGLYDKIDGNKTELLSAIREKPLTRPVKHEVKDDAGHTQTFTCNERDSARYRMLYNAAIDGTSSAASGVPDPVPSQ